MDPENGFAFLLAAAREGKKRLNNESGTAVKLGSSAQWSLPIIRFTQVFNIGTQVVTGLVHNASFNHRQTIF